MAEEEDRYRHKKKRDLIEMIGEDRFDREVEIEEES
jgi:hypothetical protein